MDELFPINTPPLKRCSLCKLSKHPDEFGGDKHRPDAKATACILCKRAASERYRTANPEKVRAASAKWKKENPEKAAEWAATHVEERQQQRKERHEAHKDEDNQKNSLYYYAHKDDLRPVRAAWEDAHREERNAGRRADRAANPDKYHLKDFDAYWKDPAKSLAKNAAYYAANPEKHREKGQKRRARLAESPVIDLSDAQFAEVCAVQKGRCYYCGKRRTLTQDHISPLGPEGPHTLHNIIGACRSCNSSKRRNAPPMPVQPLLLTLAPSKPLKKKKERS